MWVNDNSSDGLSPVRRQAKTNADFLLVSLM